MTFKEDYTTEAIKSAVLLDKDMTAEQKTAEEKKIIVSDEAYLQADMTFQMKHIFKPI
jgi:hypothetical protein